jgi:hypothetical protein
MKEWLIIYKQQFTAVVIARLCSLASEELQRPAKLQDNCGEWDAASPYCGSFLSLV